MMNSEGFSVARGNEQTRIIQIKKIELVTQWAESDDKKYAIPYWFRGVKKREKCQRKKARGKRGQRSPESSQRVGTVRVVKVQLRAGNSRVVGNSMTLNYNRVNPHRQIAAAVKSAIFLKFLH